MFACHCSWRSKEEEEEEKQQPQQMEGRRDMSYKFLAASEVLRLRREGLVIVDVRDEERSFDGHIAGSLSYLSDSFEEKIPELLQDIKGKNTIVFHCAKSQIRGPTCAQIFLDHLNKDESVGKVETLPKIYVLQGGYNGWAAAGHPVCHCGEQSCQKNFPI